MSLPDTTSHFALLDRAAGEWRTCGPAKFLQESLLGDALVTSHDDWLAAIDTLHRAGKYLEQQYSDRMTKDEARAHFWARVLLVRQRVRTIESAERLFAQAVKP